MSNTNHTQVENTSDRDPMAHMLGLLGGSDSYITGMESDGQRQLVESSTIPTDAPWGELEALGFVRGEPVKGDDMFTEATLPQGWSKKGTSHAMWSSIRDERGIERVSVFYKAAFYDRRAAAHVVGVGSGLSAHDWYEEGLPSLPSQWPLLTDAEQLDYRDGLRASIEHDEDFIEKYAQGDAERIARVARGRQLLALAVQS